MQDRAGILGESSALSEIIRVLANTIDARASASAGNSYTAKLLAKGPIKIAKKVAEEGGELALALAAEDDDAVLGEAADVLYHLLVGLKVRGLSLDQLADVLIAREGVSGLVEKASRPTD